MEWPVEMDLGQDVYADVLLSVRVNKGELLMDYTDMAKEQIILDKLSSFQSIEFDEFNPLHIIFRGPTTVRSFIFKDEDAVSNVWGYLQNSVKFVSISGKCRAYQIVPHEKKPSLIDNALSFGESLFRPKQNKKIQFPKELENSAPEALTSNLIHESLSDLQIITINEDNYLEYFDENGIIRDKCEMSHIEIKFDFTFDFWKLLLKIDPTEDDVKDYKNLILQWNPIYSSQWKHNTKLRHFVVELEKDLEDSHLPPDLKKLSFEILMSFDYQRLGKFRYSQAIHSVIVFLIDSAIIIESDDNREDWFYLHNGDAVDRTTISVALFMMFSELYDRYFDVNSKKYIFCSNEQIRKGVNCILKDQSPSTRKLLKSFKIDDYRFIEQHINAFFTIGRLPNDAEYLFTAFITAKSAPLHVERIIAASFIQLHCRLLQTQPGQEEMFKEVFLALMMKLDVRLLLDNANRLGEQISEMELDD